MFHFIQYVRFGAAAMLFGSLTGHVLRAEIIVGLTAQNSLIRFDSAAPGAIGTAVSVSGLAAGETLVGIDQRRQSDQTMEYCTELE